MNAPARREPYVDWLRAGSLIVVVLWHWAFTILRWTPTGPQPTNPLGFFSGLWIFTWLLQVMPVFFYVGGYVHLVSWERARARGDHLGRYVWGHIRQLVLPATVLMAVWAAAGVVLGAVFDWAWIGNAVMLVISPLWFLGVYVALLALLPVSLWLHRRFDFLALVWLGGLAMLVDVLRFRFGLDRIGWINMALVWGLAHQAGFYYRRVVEAPRRVDFSLLSAGLFTLMGLVFSGLYPGSMVGVPGDRWSNMAPPTFVIVALLVFQIGLAECTRPVVERLLQRRRWRWFSELVTRFALPLFLFHTTGMALARAVDYFVFEGRIVDDRAPDLIWWAERPLAVLGPLLFTVPLIALFGRARRKKSTQGEGPPGDDEAARVGRQMDEHRSEQPAPGVPPPVQEHPGTGGGDHREDRDDRERQAAERGVHGRVPHQRERGQQMPQPEQARGAQHRSPAPALPGAEQRGEHTSEGDLFDQHGAERDADRRQPEQLPEAGAADAPVLEQDAQRRHG